MKSFIKCIDCIEGMKELPDNSIDLTVTSPPYDDLRNYNSIIDFKEVIHQLYRITKEGGVVVWNVNDRIKDGSKTLTSFRQAIMFQEEGFNVNDVMIWCLSGGEYLYVKSQKGVSPMQLRDMVRLNPSSIQLWDGNKWVRVLGWKQNVSIKEKIRIQLRSGENIYCSEEHRWILKDGKEVLTKDLKTGDVLKNCILPDETDYNPGFLTDEIAWLIGLYLAQGSHSGQRGNSEFRTIQLALHSNKLSWIGKIKSAIDFLGGTVTYTLKGNKLDVRINSIIFDSVLNQFLGGKIAKDKHLKNSCWKLSNQKLKKILEGYLDGDGGYDAKNNRWRLGFTENPYLERDLRTISARLNASLTLLRRGARIKSLNKTYPSLRGEFRWETTNHYNSKSRFEILSITREKMQKNDKMWDIEVDSEEHLFSLASGVITHNCKTNSMPQVSQPRYNQCFEYMFVFSKGKPKTFNPIMVECKSAGLEYKSTAKQITGDKDRIYKEFTINDKKVADNIWKFAVAQNKTDHPSVFPEELPYRHIKTWTNEGDIVFDPFLGSGTAALVAKDMGRIYIGFEIEEKYFKIAEERLKNKYNLFDLLEDTE